MNQILTLIAVFICCTSQYLYSQSTANTLIINQATVSYQTNGATEQAISNASQFRVLEVIDHTLITNNPSGLLTNSPSNNQPLSFTLTNNGNGQESYTLNISQLITDQFDTNNTRIYIDSDNNGIFKISNDTLYTIGVNDPSLSPAASLNLFIVSDIPASVTQTHEARLELEAISNTGVGSVGDLIAGAGTSGVDAVLGNSAGRATDISFYRVTDSAVFINKRSNVADSFGGNQPITGSIITYTLEVNLSGTNGIQASTLRDNIPNGTQYISNSLQIDGVSQTDSIDSDRGGFDGTQVLFNLGNLVAPQVIEVNFQVRIL